MTPEDLAEHYPHLWHMAEHDSWPAIRQHGLLSTSAILDLQGITGTERVRIESQRRLESVRLTRQGCASMSIRDQKPMSDKALEKCLEDGLKPRDWYHILNSRTFFWLSRDRLWRLLNARAYRDKPQTVLTVDTRTLVASHQDRIELCAINSGSTLFNPPKRGKRTFISIENYDFEKWQGKRNAENAVVELVVRHSVPDIEKHVLCVHSVSNGNATEVWRRKGVPRAIGP